MAERVYQVHIIFDPHGDHDSSSGNRYVLMDETQRGSLKDLLERGKREGIILSYKIITHRPVSFFDLRTWLERVIPAERG